MRIVEYWRTSTFRLVLLFGALFLAAIVTLLGLIYWRTAGYMTRQIDLIIYAESAQFIQGGAEKLPLVLDTYQARDARHVNLYGLFARDGRWITGDLTELPSDLPPDGKVHLLLDYRKQTPGEQPARAMATTLPWGETLVVGRDVTQLYGIRRIILFALVEGGIAITVLVSILGFALSLRPLRRAQAIRFACEQVVSGGLNTRLPVTSRRDELDYVALTVNTMLEKIERLLYEVKNVSDNVAHDLRTPMTHLRARLYRLRQQAAESRFETPLIDELIEDTDAVLRRFKALLRLSEIEHGMRREGFVRTSLDRLVTDIADLYAPLAEDQGKQLELHVEAPLEWEVDAELMFEAISNLVDNAIKFSPRGSAIRVRLGVTEPSVDIFDEGPGIPEQERSAVLHAYYRGGNAGHLEGSGLGLSIVAAIVRLHGFRLDIKGDGRGAHVRILMAQPSPVLP